MTLFQLFDLVSYIAGKFSQGGALPPARFNILLPQCQDEFVQSCLNDIMVTSVNPMLYSKVMSTTPLIPMKTTRLLTSGTFGECALPDDYLRYIKAKTIYSIGNNSGAKRTRSIDIISDSEFVERQNDVFARAGFKPFAKIAGTQIEVVPMDIEDFNLDYFRYPVVPYMDWVNDGDNPNKIVYLPAGSVLKVQSPAVDDYYDVYQGTTLIYSNVYKSGLVFGPSATYAYASTSVELEFESQYHYRFVSMILSKVGINLGEIEVSKYAETMPK